MNTPTNSEALPPATGSRSYVPEQTNAKGESLRSFPAKSAYSAMFDHASLLEQQRDQLLLIHDLAIDILDGNADVIDWRNKDEPELLRKLCEHLEAKCGRAFPENVRALAQPRETSTEASDV